MGGDGDRDRVTAAPRHGVTPADGPPQWSAGTLFPLSSKKVARAINAASGARPVVMLANLSDFNGSPESLRRLQLEYGAEIGRAIVNFDGAFMLCVVSRYHGGAFVVFSAMLNDEMEVLAVEGWFRVGDRRRTRRSGGVHPRGRQHTHADERIRALEAAIAEAPDDEVGFRQADFATMWEQVRTEKLGEVAADFDAVRRVAASSRRSDRSTPSSPPPGLRPELVAAVGHAAWPATPTEPCGPVSVFVDRPTLLFQDIAGARALPGHR